MPSLASSQHKVYQRTRVTRWHVQQSHRSRLVPPRRSVHPAYQQLQQQGLKSFSQVMLPIVGQPTSQSHFCHIHTTCCVGRSQSTNYRSQVRSTCRPPKQFCQDLLPCRSSWGSCQATTQQLHMITQPHDQASRITTPPAGWMQPKATSIVPQRCATCMPLLQAQAAASLSPR